MESHLQQNGENRRQFQRIEVDHTAALSYGGHSFRDCRIKDYSAGGLYLAFGDPANPPHGLVENAQTGPTDVAIEVPVSVGGHSSLSVVARTVHISEYGVGVAFHRENTQLTEYIQTIPEISCQHPPQFTAEEKASGFKLLYAVHDLSQRFLRKHIADFFNRAQERLLSAADQASDSRQANIFHTLSSIRDQQQTISRTLENELERRFDSLRAGNSVSNDAPSPNPAGPELSLVDKNEFEEWLVIVGLSRSIEAKFSAQLHSLERTLTYLTTQPINGDRNPIAPVSLLSGLSNVLRGLETEYAERKLIYSAFFEGVLTKIRTLYEETNSLLGSQGILIQEVDHHGTGGPEIPRPTAAAEKPVRTSEHAQPVLSTLTSIASLNSGAREQAEDTDNVETIGREKIIQSLYSLTPEKSQTVLQRIEADLAQSANGEIAIRLDQNTRCTIDTTEQLVTALSEDERLGAELRQLVRWLELPMINEALAEPSLLDQTNHPLTGLLESIDRLSAYTEAEKTDEETKLALNNIVELFKDTPVDSSRNRILQAKREIDELLDKKQKVFEKNRAIVVDSRKQRDRFDQIRGLVTELLRKRLEGKSISVALDRLIHLGWPGLLIHSAVSSGITANKTTSYLSVVDYLLKVFAETSAPGNVSEGSTARLCKILKKGFTEYPVHRREAEELIREIENALHGDEDIHRALVANRVLVDEDYLQQTLQSKASAKTESNVATDSPDSDWPNLLKQLDIGEWIVQQREQGQVRLLNLAWKNPSATRFVFVDGSGNKALDTDISTLSGKFEEKQLSLLENGELPLVERAVQKMLEGTFDKIKQENRTDTLTGLMNRKTFEREVESLLKSSSESSNEHVLILLDIDRFEMINDLCGYDGGDQLLRHVTRIIRTYQGSSASIARTGDDEFGILIKNSSIEKGYQAAEAQRQALKNFQFVWEQQTIPVSASTGIVAIDKTAVRASTILKAAASACSLAKKAGRNCSRVYQWSDQDLQEQTRLVQSLPIVEKALQKDRIELHAQLITPLFRGEGQDHYEVLLRVLDESDSPTSPVDFIMAAERFEQMRAVDRWVVNAFFNWVGRQPEIQPSQNYSLNISGQSLLDDQFRKLLKQHLKSGVFPADRLGFEITETSLVKEIQQAKMFINEIRQLGSKFYLDDFGSGYASYSYLRELPVDVIKIDGVFIKDMVTDSSSYAMVKSITEIAHYMDKKVVAEYVESNEIIMSLRGLGVDYGQGYAIGKPIPLDSTLDNTQAPVAAPNTAV